MQIQIEPGVHLFVDIEGPQWRVRGPQLQEVPTLVLIHGGPGFDHASFKPFFSGLADMVQIIYFDLRSHGRSTPRPKSEWTLDTFADDVVRLCDALGIHKPMVLGQSFGGFVAQRYLARHPHHPAKVILSSTSHHMGLERKVAWFEKLGGPQAGQAAHDFWTRPCAHTWAPYERWCRPLYNTTAQDPLGSQRAHFSPDILFTWAGGEQQTMQLLPGLLKVCCPVLVMAGDTDPVTPLEDALEIAAALPAPWGRLERFAQVGHGPWRDDPKKALEVLRRFVSEGP